MCCGLLEGMWVGRCGTGKHARVARASLPGKFAGCFAAFYPGVHWQYFVVAKQLCDVLLILSQNVIVERSRCERQSLNLVDERLDYLQISAHLFLEDNITNEYLVLLVMRSHSERMQLICTLG